MSQWIRLLLGIALCNAALAQHLGRNVLVVLASDTAKDKFSLFLDSLTARGFQLDVKGARDSSIKVREYGTWLYDHMIIMSPKSESKIAFAHYTSTHY